MVATSMVRGVGPALEKALAEQGLKRAEDIAAATPEKLNSVRGVGVASASRLIAAAKEVVASETSSSDEKTGQGGEPKPALKPSASGDKKTAKSKKSDKKSNKKPIEKAKEKKGAKGKAKAKAKKKGRKKTSDKGNKKKSRKDKSGKKT